MPSPAASRIAASAALLVELLPLSMTGQPPRVLPGLMSKTVASRDKQVTLSSLPTGGLTHPAAICLDWMLRLSELTPYQLLSTRPCPA